MSGECFVVPPRSRLEVRSIAKSVRQMIGWNQPCFPIVQFMEIYREVEPEFVYDIREVSELGDNHGLTYPDKKEMYIREDVYDGAAEGFGRDRMTIAHEFGHLFLHAGIGFARKLPSNDVLRFCSSEWQANCFGGELLISADHVQGCGNPDEVAELFQVSGEAAETQWRVFRREGLF